MAADDSASVQLTTASKKEKVKTRGVADPSKTAESQQPQENNEEDEPDLAAKHVFRLSRRAMGVIKVLFHHPSAHNQPGEVTWKDFLIAIAEVGFAGKKWYGSAWCFTPEKEQLTRLSDRSIMFHEPHPTGRLRFVQTRQYGRRLTMTMGWTRLRLRRQSDRLCFCCCRLAAATIRGSSGRKITDGTVTGGERAQTIDCIWELGN